ncbi:MAG TPA: hypothetical protein VMV72_18580 [Verrucomicrobiae bacterium]|nr:hypothetical protein [Verrucomicrobiae bacterium]
MNENQQPKLREPLEIAYEDGRRESIIVKRLSNTDMMKWIDLGFDKAFLVFRSVERAVVGRVPSRGDFPSPGGDQAVGQSWFDSLTRDSAFAVVEHALALNHSPVEKKVMAAVLENLQSWLSLATPPNSSAPAATVSTS